MYSKKYNKKKIKKTRKQKGRGFLFSTREETPPEQFYSVLMEKLQNNKKLNSLLQNPTDENTRLHANILGAVLSQIYTCVYQLDIIERDDIDNIEKYKIGVLYDIEPGKENMKIYERHREFYTSIVIRLWVILNTLKNQFYEYPYNFMNNKVYNIDGREEVVKSLVDRTILMIRERADNYFIEPLYLDIDVIKNIILWKQQQLSTDKLIDIIISYFNKNFDKIREYVLGWSIRSNPSYFTDFTGEYYIDSYLKFLNSDLTVLRKTLVLDIKIYRKLLSQLLQLKIDIRSETEEETKIALEKNITNLENLTNNMKTVFDKYFSQYGGKKSRKKRRKLKKKYTNKNGKKKLVKKN